jgi:hypothetical protein
MDCNRLPEPQFWDEESAENLRDYRSHIQLCSECRAHVLKNAPEQVLFDLQDESMPDEFWLGFWDSVSRKRRMQAQRLPVSGRIVAAVRWAAVLILGLAIVFYGRSLPDGERPASALTSDYPVIENLQNPQARYYIFQTSNQKVVMVIDPDLEL